MKLLFDAEAKGKPMRIACFMSGTGTNARKLIEYQKSFENKLQIPPFKIVAIFTDNPDSNAKAIANEFELPYLEGDFGKFIEGKEKNSESRKQFDRMAYWMIKSCRADAIALCGYSRIVTAPILDNYLVVNVHPGDLSVAEDGKRRYVGLHNVPAKKAILAGEQFLHSTTHIVTEELDAGSLLVISKPLTVELPYGVNLDDLRNPENEKLLDEVASKHQDMLKEIGDWEILPLTLHWIAEGRFGIGGDNKVYLDGREIINGYRL